MYIKQNEAHVDANLSGSASCHEHGAEEKSMPCDAVFALFGFGTTSYA